MSIIPIIVKRRKSIVQRFESTKTLDETNAKLLEQLDLKYNKDIAFLLLKRNTHENI